MIQDNYKIYYGDRFGQATAINHLMDNLLVIAMDRKNTTGLSWYYHGGDVVIDSTVYTVADGFITLTDNDMNYIYVNNSGVVSKSLVGYESGIPIAQITTASGAITEYIDKRAWLGQNNLSGYLKLDQTTPQTVINGVPIFDLGIECNNLTAGQICYPDANGKIIGESALSWDYTLNKMTVNGSATFYTTAESTLSGQAGVSIKNDFNITGAPIALSLEGNLQSSANHAYALFGNTTLEPGNTKHARFINISGTINAVTGRTVQAYGLFIPTFTKTGTGTISNTYGLALDPQTIGTKNYGLFQRGTAMYNYFEGVISIGQTTPTYKLQITPTAGVTAGQTVLFQDATATTGSTKLVIKSGAGQSTDTLQEWQNVSAAVMGSISESELITPATLTIKNSTKLNSFTNSASQSAGTLAYTLPSAYPAVTGYVLSATDAGVMSWVAASGGSYTFTDSVYENAGTVNLLNDSAAPGNDYFYGTDGTGTKGWFALPSGSSPIIEDATPSFALHRLNESLAGNTRGYYAIDLQYEKANAAQVASAVHSLILGGKNNQNDNLRGIIVGGNGNFMMNAIIFGGADEVYSGNSVIVGGAVNFIGTNNRTCFIGGGALNKIESVTDTVYGMGSHVITGGLLNEIKATGSPYYQFVHTIGGGQQNKITATQHSTIAGGILNEIKESFSAIAGGYSNEVFSTKSFVGGGYLNTISNGGDGNNVICGGYDNFLQDGWDVICGGYQNYVRGNYGFIGGGKTNKIDQSTEYNTIGGGLSNLINGGADYCFVGGGLSNTHYSGSNYATISGGRENTADGDYCFVGGGYGNVVKSNTNTICGGNYNSINGVSSEYNLIGAGQSNVIYNLSDYCVIGGGKSNSIGNYGDYSTIPGGYLNSANSSYSFACGSNAHADSANCFVFADGNSTTSSRTNQALFGVQGGLYIAYNNSNWVDFYDDSMGNQITTSSGATLTTGGVWTDASSKTLKIKTADVDNAVILQKVMNVPVQEYQYKKEIDAVKHIGLYSEDFYQAFGVGNDKGLGATDLCGVLWSAVQALKSELDDLKNSIKSH